MIVINWRLALASLISLPFMMFGLWYIQTRSHVRWQIYRKKNSNLNAFIHEDLSGMRIIQSFTAEDETAESFNGLLKEHRNSFVSAIVFNDAFGSVIDICWGVGTLAMYYTAIRVLKINADNEYLMKVAKRGESCNSDHCPFYKKGVPAVFIYSNGKEYLEYHNPNDKAENLPLTEYSDIFRLIRDYINSL
jgi:ABC-type multidrug transport system fused ATPase/permease subunit